MSKLSPGVGLQPADHDCSGNHFTETIVPGTKSLTETLHLGELALSTAREIGSRPDVAYTLLALAVCLGSRGECARAAVPAAWAITRGLINNVQ